MITGGSTSATAAGRNVILWSADDEPCPPLIVHVIDYCLAEKLGVPPAEVWKTLVVKGSGLFYEDTGVLVGSRFLVADCLARLVHDFGVPLASAVGMATLNPARLLGYTRKGALLPGYDADVAILSRDFSRCSFLSWEGRPLFEEGRA